MGSRIIGIALVQNEENFVSWALGNVIDFVDELIVLDNRSSDGTWPQLEALARQFPKVRLLREPDALSSNAHIQPYIGQDVWVFGIDGDEIYDREGLARLREDLLAGKYAGYWRLLGHAINATRVHLSAGEAIGYVPPRSPTPTKLYNFAHIVSWHSNTQRLHGQPVFRAGSHRKLVLQLYQTEAWKDCAFRCLHLCFFPRSSRDETVAVRRNITDKSLRNVVRRPLFGLLKLLGLERGPLGSYLRRRRQLKKMVRYAQGDLLPVTLDAGFGRPSAPDRDRVERLLEDMSRQRITTPSAGLPTD